MKILLHVGPGHARLEHTTPGFNNGHWQELRLDIDPTVQPDILGSMTDMSQVNDQSVDAIFSSHNIEHLYPHEVPTALATGKVNGQENPVNVVLSSKLYETQSHMMLTGHIMNAQVIVINERAWQGLSAAQREQLSAAAAEVRRKATDMVRGQEASETEELKKLKMTVVGPAEGLNLAAFQSSVRKAVDQKFGAKYGELYKPSEAVR